MNSVFYASFESLDNAERCANAIKNHFLKRASVEVDPKDRGGGSPDLVVVPVSIDFNRYATVPDGTDKASESVAALGITLFDATSEDESKLRSICRTFS